MSDSKSGLHPTSNNRNSEAPPPSYDESVSSPTGYSPQLSNSSSFIDTYIWPHLNGEPITTLVLVPSNVTGLQPPTDFSSTKSKPAAGLDGTFIGFRAEESPILVPLQGPENRLETWQRPATLHRLEDHLRRRLSQEGYRMSTNETQAMPPTPSRIAGSRDVDWKYVERNGLAAGQMRMNVRMDEVCLRTENAMGLYETRSGKAVIVTVELGHEAEAETWR
ncbi:MAG: hypothetical protein Q9183_005711 [Haloplaca sp. 2 TL-2023]